MFGGGGQNTPGISSRAAPSLSLCGSLGLGFATPEILLRLWNAPRIFQASTAVSTHPYGSLDLCEIYPKVITHSDAIPELNLREDTVSWPRGC